jgi:hypothetical protein
LLLLRNVEDLASGLEIECLERLQLALCMRNNDLLNRHLLGAFLYCRLNTSLPSKRPSFFAKIDDNSTTAFLCSFDAFLNGMSQVWATSAHVAFMTNAMGVMCLEVTFALAAHT